VVGLHAPRRRYAMQLKFKKLHPDAILPKYQAKGSSGFDLHALVLDEDITSVEHTNKGVSASFFSDIFISPNEKYIVRTGLAVVIPEGFEIQIRPRSGLAAKYGITIINSPGTIDASYRNEIMIILYNMGAETFVIHPGDRIAQGVVQKVEIVDMIEVDNFTDEEMSKDRGGGFGSTGVK